MGRVRLTLVGVCLALAAGCGDNLKPPGQSQPPPAPTGPTGQPSPPAAWMRFAPSLAAAKRGAWQEEFPLYQQSAVIAVITVPDGPGVRKLRVEVQGPTGDLLYTMWAGFSTETSHPDSTSLGEPGTEMPVHRAERLLGKARVLLPIQVAGTVFTRHHLAGKQTLTVYVDDAAQPTLSGSFQLRGAE